MPWLLRQRECPSSMSKDMRGMLGAKLPHALKTLRQAFTLRQLHGDERRAVVDAVVQNLNTVGTSDSGGCLRLTPKACEGFCRGYEFRVDELDCDFGMRVCPVHAKTEPMHLTKLW